MPEDNKQDYSVGYGKPPKHSQFQKGRSGNPRGRPKWFVDPDLSELFKKFLFELVSVNEEGRHKKITKLEALVKKAIYNAISKGSRKDVEFVLSMIARADRRPITITELREMVLGPEAD